MWEFREPPSGHRDRQVGPGADSPLVMGVIFAGEHERAPGHGEGPAPRSQVHRSADRDRPGHRDRPVPRKDCVPA